MTASQPRDVRIIHFNDVYNINVAPIEPVGGAARFITAMRDAISTSPHQTLVLFSGDAFSPAPLTSLTDGKEIPPILNAARVDVACMGNHELDRGLPVFRQRVTETNFPWLVSNLYDRHTNAPLGGLFRKHVLSRAGITFGFMGLAAPDWISTLDKIDPSDLLYFDFILTANQLAAELREQDACDVVIALTHMREPDDELLAEKAVGIDLVLGGHDHIEWSKAINGRWCVKSGTDFKNFSTIDITLDDSGLSVKPPVHHSITSDVEPDLEFEQFVTDKLALLGPSYFENLAISKKQLDGRFVAIRTRETGLGNFVCDAMASSMGVLIGLINAGSFRSDSVDPPGFVTQQTIDAILPFKDDVIVVEYTGSQLLAVLENSVSQYPLLDGRFCQVAGISFKFDPQHPPGSRVDRESVLVCQDSASKVPIEKDTMYKVAIKSFMFLGKDGYPKGNPDRIIAHASVKLPHMLLDYLRTMPSQPDMEIPIISPEREQRIQCVRENEILQQRYGF